MKTLLLVLALGLATTVEAMTSKSLDNHTYNVGDTISLSTGSKSNIYLAVKSSEIKNDNISYKGIIKAKPQLKVVVTKVYLNDDNKLCFEAKDENGIFYNIDVNRALILDEIVSNKKDFVLNQNIVSEYKASECYPMKSNVF
jgi:hypothetical protein